jgi:hypothetical protein
VTNWDFYVKESYDLVRRAECELAVNLAHELEAYLVHMWAHYLDKPNVNTTPVCIKLLESTHNSLTQRKEILKQVGDECLLINSMEWGRSRWPTLNYYSDMGQMAYINRAFIVNPPDDLYDSLALEFQTATKILRKCRIK